jgi:hypothetical protein
MEAKKKQSNDWRQPIKSGEKAGDLLVKKRKTTRAQFDGCLRLATEFHYVAKLIKLNLMQSHHWPNTGLPMGRVGGG